MHEQGDGPTGGVREPEPLSHLIERENKRHAQRTRRRWIIGILAPIALAALWFFVLRAKPVPMSARFRLGSVTQGDIVRQVRATGNVEAVTMVAIGAEVSGRIASVYADFNDRVTKGQVLARFDRTLLMAQYSEAEAAARAAIGTLGQAKATRDKAIQDFNRSKELHTMKLLAESDYESVTAALRTAEQAVISAESQVASLEAAAAAARTNLSHGVIYSPIDGIVITRNIDSGQTLASVFQTPELFTIAADLHKMQVIAAVDEADIGEIAVGQRATFSVNAYPNRVFEGVVTQVRNSPVVVQDVVTYGAVITVENTDLALKPGMTATVRITTASVRDVLRIPSTAVRFTPPQKNAAASAVWVLIGDSVRRVEVHEGISDGDLTAIDAGVLRAGNAVIEELTPEGKKAYGLAK